MKVQYQNLEEGIGNMMVEVLTVLATVMKEIEQGNLKGKVGKLE